MLTQRSISVVARNPAIPGSRSTSEDRIVATTAKPTKLHGESRNALQPSRIAKPASRECPGVLVIIGFEGQSEGTEFKGSAHARPL